MRQRVDWSKPLPGLLVVRDSDNRKTGHVGATYREVGPTCPPECALLDVVCYAQGGLTQLHSRNSSSRSDSLEKLVGVPLVRHDVSGDSFRDGRLDVPYVKAKLAFHWAHPETQGWDYTHRHWAWDDHGLGPEVWPPNYACLASVDNLGEAKLAWKAGWNTARVTKDASDRHPSEEICPYDAAAHHKVKPKVQCVTCEKCWRGKNILFLEI